MSIESIRNPYNDLRRERIIKRLKSIIKVLLVLLSLLLLFGCSKDSEEDKLFTDKTRSKKYTRADLIQKYNNGTIEHIGVFYKYSREKGYQQAGFNSASKTCYKYSNYTAFTVTNETSTNLEGIGELPLNRGTEIFIATTNDGSVVNGTTGELVYYEDYYDIVDIWKSLAVDNSCANLGF